MANQIKAPINYPIIAGGKIVSGGSVLFGQPNVKPDEDNPSTLKAIYLDAALSQQAENPQGISSDGVFDQSDTGILYGPTDTVYSIVIRGANKKELSYIPEYDLSDANAAQTAQDAAAEAASSEANAIAAKDLTEALYTDFTNRYFGAYSSNPAVDDLGNPPNEGSIYFNTVSDVFFTWNGSAWVNYFPSNPNGLLVTATGTTTPRALSDWVGDVVNVKAFGAIGDGVTDELSAFNSASASFDELTIVIPKGVYLLSSPPMPTSPKVTWLVQRGASFVNPNSITAGVNQKIVSEGNYDSIESDPDFYEGIFNYLEHNSALTGYGNLGLHGSVQTAWREGAGTSGADIGVSGFAVNNKLNHTGGAWALYGTAVRESGVTASCFGMELDIANMGDTRALFPFNPFNAGQSQTLWLGSGGEISETAEGVNLGTASCAIGIISNDPAKNADFEKGIVFHNEAIAGTDGATGVGVAVAMATRQSLAWYNAANTKVGEVLSTNTAGSNKQRVNFSEFGLDITDLNTGNSQLLVENTPAASSKLIVRASETDEPTLAVAGSSANIDVKIQPKGDGRLKLQYTSQAATTPANFVANRYLEIKDSTGAVMYLPLMTSPW